MNDAEEGVVAGQAWAVGLTLIGLAGPALAQQEVYTYRSAQLTQFYTSNKPNPYRGGKRVVVTITVPAPLPPRTVILFSNLDATVTYNDGVNSITAPANDPAFADSSVQTGQDGRIVKSGLEVGPGASWELNFFPKCKKVRHVFGGTTMVSCDHLGGFSNTVTDGDQANATAAGNWRVYPPIPNGSDAKETPINGFPTSFKE